MFQQKIVIQPCAYQISVLSTVSEVCYVPVSWTGSWILLASSNTWLWLSKLSIMFPVFSYLSDLESLRTKIALELPWRAHTSASSNPDGSRISGPWTLDPHPSTKKGSSRLLELHTRWRSKVKLTGEVPPQKQMASPKIPEHKLHLQYKNLYSFCHFTTCFFSLPMHKKIMLLSSSNYHRIYCQGHSCTTKVTRLSC